MLRAMNTKLPVKYFIQISEVCTNYWEEYFWNVGLNAFINPDKVDISELKQISDDMWSKYYENKSKEGPMSSDALTTIGIIDGDNMKILYSTKSFNTQPEKIGKILDTAPHNDDFGDFECYRNDYSDSDSGDNDSDDNDSDDSDSGDGLTYDSEGNEVGNDMGAGGCTSSSISAAARPTVKGEREVVQAELSGGGAGGARDAVDGHPLQRAAQARGRASPCDQEPPSQKVSKSGPRTKTMMTMILGVPMVQRYNSRTVHNIFTLLEIIFLLFII